MKAAATPWRCRLFSRIFSKTVLLCCFVSLLMLVPLLIAGPEVQAQPCKILEFNEDYPSNAIPGQAIQVRTTIGVSCAQWRTYYSARVDLVESESNNLLSISTFDIGSRPNVTATVANTATAPQATGSWGLELVLYIFESGGLVVSANRSFNIQVGTVSVATAQTTSTVETTSVGTTITPTQPIVTSQTSTRITPAASPLALEPISFAAGALVACVFAAAVALILKARKRNA